MTGGRLEPEPERATTTQSKQSVTLYAPACTYALPAEILLTFEYAGGGGAPGLNILSGRHVHVQSD